jgi:hypothetical protein
MEGREGEGAMELTQHQSVAIEIHKQGLNHLPPYLLSRHYKILPGRSDLRNSSVHCSLVAYIQEIYLSRYSLDALPSHI